MIKPIQLAVLDVGHGSAAVLFDTGGVVVIDTGKGGLLLDFLEGAGVKVVDLLLVSHSDDDHVGAAPSLLLDKSIGIKKAYYNSDAEKDTKSWRAFRDAIKVARIEKGMEAHAELTTVLSGKLNHGEVEIEVLFPPPELATTGPGGASGAGETITSNSMSAVIRLTKGGVPCVLLAGDSEKTCLDVWREEKVDPQARILVYPHHGGEPGTADPVEFAAELCELVKPGTMLFSINRTKYKLPIPEVIAKARLVLKGVRIACTQLSSHCAAVAPAPKSAHLVNLPARGSEAGHCCAGTMVIDLNGKEPIVHPLLAAHDTFIKKVADTALCLR